MVFNYIVKPLQMFAMQYIGYSHVQPVEIKTFVYFSLVHINKCNI